ncbi:aspartic proteinase PCS1 [Vicia villosa]|uniref:aspartic proteinase PCS1 n=1 Tax=Vicia villosa TaxID=3911 RepID=UPI00273CB0E5|nr:aspartic proteinase PCS1 [Vicia villosa]
MKCTIPTNPLLKILTFFILHTFPLITQSKILTLPLKSQVISSGYLPRPPNKLRFHHNVSLTVSITVGTPPQNVSLVIDTGSELSWLHCNNTNTTNRVSQNPFFNPNLSSSYRPISCSSSTCTTRTRDFPIPASCDSNNLCHATLSYADFSSSEGNLASDSFGFGGSDNPGTVFGCMKSSVSTNIDGDFNTTGLMGLNLGSLSLVSQLKIPKFSYCISGSDLSGILLLGGSNFSWVGSLNYTPLVQISIPLPYFDRAAYSVRLIGIKVSGKLLNLSNDMLIPDHTGAGQTMFDLGTQFTFLLGPVYSVLREEFLNQTNGTLSVLDNSDFVFQEAIDLCYRVPLNQSKLPELPSVSLVFEGAEMRISGDQLLYRVPNRVLGNDSVYCFTFGNSDLLGVESFIIGHHQQQNMWMEFDLVQSRVGLAHIRCDLVGQKVLSMV